MLKVQFIGVNQFCGIVTPLQETVSPEEGTTVGVKYSHVDPHQKPSTLFAMPAWVVVVPAGREIGFGDGTKVKV